MSGLELGAAALRRAVAVPIESAVGRPAGVDAWLGRGVGQFVLDAGLPTERTIDALMPSDPAAFQYVSDLPGEAIVVARRAAVTNLQSQVALHDAQTGAWHVAGLVDATGAPIRMDELGAIRQGWTTARFDTNHQAAGGVFGEAHDFPLRDDLRAAADALEFDVPMADIPAVATDSALAAFGAASRAEVSMAAPMRAAPLPALHSVEPVAAFAPVEGIPGALQTTLFTHPVRGDITADLERLRATAGSIDDVHKLARRYSIELGGQQVAAFETAPDAYLLAPLVGSRSGPIRADEVSGLLARQPEARFVTGPSSGRGPDIPRAPNGIDDALDPARVARRLRELDRAIDAPQADTLVARVADRDARHARIAQIDEELTSAGFRERGALKRERRELERAGYLADPAASRAILEDEGSRATMRRQRDELTTFVERMHLPEREEWVARFGFGDDGTPNLQTLAPADADATYADLANAARQAAFGSDRVGHVVLRANDGAFWRGTTRISPEELVAMDRGGSRPTEAIRTISVGGRTLQWDDTARRTLS